MKAHHNSDLATLTQDELLCIGGSIGALDIPVLRAEDMWGNTMSIEEYMDLQLQGSAHDFYGPGFDSDKPNIYRP